MAEFEKSHFARFLSVLTRPLQKDPIGCLLFYVLFSGIQVIDRSCGFFSYGMYMAVFAFLQFYTAIVLLMLSYRVYRIVKPILGFLLSLFFVFGLSCYTHFNSTISPDIISILLATNVNEAKEFVSIYFNEADYIFGVLILIVIVLIYWLSERIQVQLCIKVQSLFSALFLVCCLAILRNNEVAFNYWKDVVYIKFNETVDLSKHFTHPLLDYSKETIPDKVVVVIGESFTSGHSSLYGYPIKTNPRLEAMLDDSLLYVYPTVISPSTHTVRCFKYILNTHLLTDPDSVEWYDSFTVMELFKSIGYTTSWYSNQVITGTHNNIASMHGLVCDHTAFVNNNKAPTSYDGKLLDIKVTKESRQVYFYHLRGQHGAYDMRYPSEFDVFSDSLYQQFPSHQVEPRRTYDNATLYNDYVVSEIFRKFENDDALCFYFPDHGQDFYDVDDGFYGHGRPGNSASVEAARKIPFMVYVSRKCQNLHPDLLSKIIETKDSSMCTDAFIFYLMNLLKIQRNDS